VFSIFFRYTVPCDGASEHRDVKSPRRWVTLSCLPLVTRITPNITSDKGKNGKAFLLLSLLLSHVALSELLDAPPFAFLRLPNTRPRAYTRTASLCVLFKSLVTRIGSACRILSPFVLSKIRFLARFSEIQFGSSSATTCRFTVASPLALLFLFINVVSRGTSAEYPCQNVESRTENRYPQKGKYIQSLSLSLSLSVVDVFYLARR